MISSPDEMVVVQSVPRWLPLTSPWLYRQIVSLPATVRNHVFCETTENIEQFRYEPIHVAARSPARYVIDRGIRKLHLRPYLGQLASVVRQTDAALVHSHLGDTGWRDRGAVLKSGVKHVVQFYGKDVNYLVTIDPRWRTRYEDLFASVDCVLCEGPHMAGCIAALGCPEDKIRVQPLGINVGEIPFRPRVWSPGDSFNALIAASFREKKGIPLALRALGELLRRGVDVRVTIIGDASDDPRSTVEKARILQAIEDGGLTHRVTLLGYRSREFLLDASYKHSVFLSPSLTAADGDTEGGAPVSLIDMSATGIPIVSSFHCDIPFVVQHRRTGLLATEGDLEGLVECLLTVLSEPERWLTMVHSARLRMEQEYEAELLGERLASIYSSLLGEHVHS